MFPFPDETENTFTNETEITFTYETENVFLKETENAKHIQTVLSHEKRKCTQRNLFEILLNKTEIRLYLPFSD